MLEFETEYWFWYLAHLMTKNDKIRKNTHFRQYIIKIKQIANDFKQLKGLILYPPKLLKLKAAG